MSVGTPSKPERSRQGTDVLAPLGSVLQEEDTRRVDLAQRLHRDVAGGLVACTSLSEMIRHELRQEGENDALGILTNLEAALRQTIRVVHDLTGEQLPAVLKTFGLGGALRQLADHPGTPIELTLTGDEPTLSLSQRLCLHHVLSALIGRIRTHAGASSIEVIGMFEPSRMEILLEHNGAEVMRPLSAEDTSLATIKGRIAHLGGRLLLSRSTADGPRSARLVLPLPINTGNISSQTKTAPLP
jgi:signal transduction histidine kinase